MPSNDEVLRGFLKLPEEELQAFEDNRELERVIRKYVNSAYSEEGEESFAENGLVQLWETGIGKNAAGSLRYLLRSEDGTMLFTGRIRESWFSKIMESVGMLYEASKILSKEISLADCAGTYETPPQP